MKLLMDERQERGLKNVVWREPGQSSLYILELNLDDRTYREKAIHISN